MTLLDLLPTAFAFYMGFVACAWSRGTRREGYALALDHVSEELRRRGRYACFEVVDQLRWENRQ